ncbi:MAG: DUF481 domain-containing protein [Desulfatiglans sp.]|jgi:putative salt-induced outer membrane protein|nr:DUF481 domain-containing protein [Thermodesulfobacteriota bacterium]MEE4352823.1 DUF481 domain-containing protein [Desulfatiglans sp.]
MKKSKIVVIAAMLLLVSSVAYGETKKWSDEAELSYVETSGNTEVKTLSAKNLLQYRFSEKLKGTWELGVLYGETDEEKTAEKYNTELRLDRSVTERFFAFFAGGWEKDEFAGIDARYYGGPGVGYKIIDGPKHLLLTEVGLNYVKEEYTDNSDSDYLEGRFFAKYGYSFTEKTRFSQTFEYLHDFDNSDNYNINAESAIIAALNNYLSLKTSYLIEYDHEPVPADLDTTDTTLSVALVVNF